MLVTADKFYGVTFNNQKVSSIRVIRREEAQEFVDQVRIFAAISHPNYHFCLTCYYRKRKHSDRRLSAEDGSEPFLALTNSGYVHVHILLADAMTTVLPLISLTYKFFVLSRRCYLLCTVDVMQ